MWVWFKHQGLLLTPTPRVTLGRSVLLSGPQCSHLGNGANRFCPSHLVGAPVRSQTGIYLVKLEYDDY